MSGFKDRSGIDLYSSFELAIHYVKNMQNVYSLTYNG